MTEFYIDIHADQDYDELEKFKERLNEIAKTQSRRFAFTERYYGIDKTGKCCYYDSLIPDDKLLHACTIKDIPIEFWCDIIEIKDIKPQDKLDKALINNKTYEEKINWFLTYFQQKSLQLINNLKI